MFFEIIFTKKLHLLLAVTGSRFTVLLNQRAIFMSTIMEKCKHVCWPLHCTKCLWGS